MTLQHGGDIYHNKIEYDFSANINPLGMPKGCGKAMEKMMPHIDVYPDCRGEKLRQAIATAEGVDVSQVLLGNGAAELIYTICYALRPKKACTLAPTFSEYENAVIASGGSMEFWELKEQDGFRLKEWYAETPDVNQEMIVSKQLKQQGISLTDIDVLFLCNPNNPTGVTIEKEQLLAIARQCEHNNTYFCIDECFLPFLEQEKDCTMKHELNTFPHLLILRAFTKIYGMPGLRLGYMLTANRKLSDKMWHCLPPWNTSAIAQAAGVAALEDLDFLQQTRRMIQEEKEYLLEELRNGLTEQIYDSKANYIFFRSRPDLQKCLLEKKILIRDCSDYRNLKTGYFRIAVRSHTENKELIRRWRELD